MGSEHDATAGRVCWLDRWRVILLCLELGRESAWRVVTEIYFSGGGTHDTVGIYLTIPWRRQFQFRRTPPRGRGLHIRGHHYLGQGPGERGIVCRMVMVRGRVELWAVLEYLIAWEMVRIGRVSRAGLLGREISTGDRNQVVRRLRRLAGRVEL